MHVDPRICGLAFQNLGAIAAQRAHLDAARRFFLESQRYFVRADYRWGEALAMNNRAAIALDQGRYKEAEVIAGQTIVAAKKIGDLELLGIALLNQAEALAGQRRLEEAHAPALEAMRFFDLEENNLRRAQCFRILADFKIMQGETAGARELYERALELAVSVGSEWEASRVRDAMELASAAA
jgi:ATP/maltotriose-dependent transcriptional regulator MalT